MAKLDVEWLSVFVEVYQARSVSKAALRLQMAQASASIALNKLRRHFADPLFVRTSLGMEPTPRATTIYPELSEALARIRLAQGAVQPFSPTDSRREFRVGMTDISEVVLLPTLINHLCQVAPGVSIEAENLSASSRQRLESGEMDLAVGFTPDLDAGFYQQVFFEQDFVCLASEKHPRARGKVDRRTFCDEGHVVVTTRGTGHFIVDKVLARENIQRRVMLRVPSFLGVAQIVADTELLVVVPRLLGEKLAEQARVQVLRPPVRLPTYRVKQHWHERFNAEPGNVWLRQVMARLFMGMPKQSGRTQSLA
jgi:DNA-binding transcriptional LysR family regulator